MKAIVSESVCIGCGLCAEICPEIFVMNERMIAEVIPETVAPDLQDCARDAMESCPVSAITLE